MHGVVDLGLGWKKFGSNSDQANSMPTCPSWELFFIVYNGMYYTFVNQNKTLKYRQLLAAVEINLRKLGW